MDRRSFLRAASAAGLAPLLPALPAAAAPAAAAAPVVNEFMYGLAVFNARVRGASSAAKIARDLGIAKEAAASIQSKMVAEGLVGMPNAAGLAKAHKPFVQGNPYWQRQLKEAAREKAEQLVEHVLEGDTPQSEEATPEESQSLEA